MKFLFCIVLFVTEAGTLDVSAAMTPPEKVEESKKEISLPIEEKENEVSSSTN